MIWISFHMKGNCKNVILKQKNWFRMGTKIHIFFNVPFKVAQRQTIQYLCMMPICFWHMCRWYLLCPLRELWQSDSNIPILLKIKIRAHQRLLNK
jgi:hypothetical protein